MDYSKYKFSKKELLSNLFIAVFLILVVAKLFYGNYFISIVLSPLIIVFFKLRKHILIEKRKKELKKQFKDAIVSLADLMNVGYSMENSIKESYREMVSVYGSDSYICIELANMIKKMKINTPIEKVFADLAKRTQVNDIILFSQVLIVAKRIGGNMISLIQMVSDNISQSINVEEEINVIISEKKMEQRIMSVVPIGMILYMNITSPDFLKIMYETAMGRIVMTVCLVVYVAAFFIAEKIMNIEM